MKECLNCKAQLEDNELFCHECGASQETEEVETQVEEQSAIKEKTCIHCGKAIDTGIQFCPYCGHSLKYREQAEDDRIVLHDFSNINLSKNVLPGIKELLEKHINCLADNPEKEVITNIALVIGTHTYNIYLSSEKSSKLIIHISFDKSKECDSVAYKKFTDRKYDSLFYSESSIIEKYEGICKFNDVSDQVIGLLSSIIIDIYGFIVDHSVIGYDMKVDGNYSGVYRIENGQHVKSKGCSLVISIFVILGVTLWGLF